ncbi:SRPBCC family protein [Gordonia sp. NPDC003424]
MPNPRTMSCSRAIPVSVDDAFATTLPVPLPDIFRRWYGPIGPVRSATADDGASWGRVGQTRTVVQVGGSSMRETLTTIDPPHRFAYTLNDITGPLAPLIDHVDGEWLFTPAGTGTDVTWTWHVTPTQVGAVTLPVFERLWSGYARQALEVLSDLMLGR